jgi:hypothetical protein
VSYARFLRRKLIALVEAHAVTSTLGSTTLKIVTRDEYEENRQYRLWTGTEHLPKRTISIQRWIVQL